MPQYYVDGLFANKQGVKKKRKAGVYPPNSIEPYAKTIWANSPKEAIQVFVTNRLELEAQLPRLKALLAPKGMIWVTYHKGTSKVKTDINRETINAYAHTLGLEGVAMISIDEDWSALRLKPI